MILLKNTSDCLEMYTNDGVVTIFKVKNNATPHYDNDDSTLKKTCLLMRSFTNIEVIETLLLALIQAHLKHLYT